MCTLFCFLLNDLFDVPAEMITRDVLIKQFRSFFSTISFQLLQWKNNRHFIISGLWEYWNDTSRGRSLLEWAQLELEVYNFHSH